MAKGFILNESKIVRYAGRDFKVSLYDGYDVSWDDCIKILQLAREQVIAIEEIAL